MLALVLTKACLFVYYLMKAFCNNYCYLNSSKSLGILFSNMLQLNLMKKIINKSILFILVLFIFKIFLFFFYFISGYQMFSVITIKIILRITMSIDILLIFFSIVNIIKFFLSKKVEKKIIKILLLFLNILFSFITFSFAFLILVIAD